MLRPSLGKLFASTQATTTGRLSVSYALIDYDVGKALGLPLPTD